MHQVEQRKVQQFRSGSLPALLYWEGYRGVEVRDIRGECESSLDERWGGRVKRRKSKNTIHNTVADCFAWHQKETRVWQEDTALERNTLTSCHPCVFYVKGIKL